MGWGTPRWRPALLLLAILAIALGVRLTGLLERGIWLDETVSLDVAAHPVGEIVRGEVFDNHTPPLYYLLLKAWFGVVPEGLLTLRLLSVLVDLGVLGLLVGTVARAWGRWPALAVGAGYAVAPFAVRLAQEGRMYPLLVSLVVACYALALELDRRRRTASSLAGPAFALALLAAAALYTHYYAALSLLALHVAMAWRLRGDRRAGRAWWGAMATSALLFVPWLPVVGELLASGGQHFRAFGVSVVPYAFLRFAVGFAVLPTTVEGKVDLGRAVVEALPLLLAVGLGVGVVLVLGAVRAWRGRGGGGPVGGGAADRRAAPGAAGRLAVVLAAAPPLLALAVAAVVPSLDERYLAVCFPFVLVLAVLGLGVPVGEPGGAPGASGAPGATGWRRRWAWPFRAVAVGVFLAGTAAHLVDPDAGTTPWRTLAAELERRASEGASEAVSEGGVVLVRPGYYAEVLRRNLAGGGWRVVPVPEEGLGRREGMVAGAGPASPAWLVEVAFLTRDGSFDHPRWRVGEERLLPAGNGLRLSRLLPRAAPPDGAGRPGTGPGTERPPAPAVTPLGHDREPAGVGTP